ncbi:Putative membrane protein (fragment) [Capnocytophaga canimorsus]
MSIPSTKYGLIFFFFIALIGVWLRALHWVSIPLSYSHLVHAHSHVAFQGWVYVTLFLLLIRSFLADGNLKKYRWQFFATIITVLGILVSFAFYGYGLYSITFSTLFQLLNYVFMFCFWKDTRHYLGSSIQWVRVGFAFGVLSSIIPFYRNTLSQRILGNGNIPRCHFFVFTFSV